MIERRKLFGFLAVSPIAAAGAIAKAKQPREISVERITLGRYEIALKGERLVIGAYDSRNIISFDLPPKV